MYVIYVGEHQAKPFWEENILIVRIQCTVKSGFVPSERTVYIRRADGALEEVTVSKRSLSAGKLEASEIGRKPDQVLVELPRESASGHWRIWVRKSQVGAVRKSQVGV